MPQPMEWGRTLQKNKLCSYLISAAERETSCSNLSKPSPEIHQLTRLASANLGLILSDYLFFFPPQQNKQCQMGPKGWKKLVVRKYIMGKAISWWKLHEKLWQVSLTTVLLEGARTFNFLLAIAPTISHSLISTCDTPHTKPPGSLHRKAKKFEKLTQVFSDKLFLARQESLPKYQSWF